MNRNTFTHIVYIKIIKTMIDNNSLFITQFKKCIWTYNISMCYLCICFVAIIGPTYLIYFWIDVPIISIRNAINILNVFVIFATFAQSCCIRYLCDYIHFIWNLQNRLIIVQVSHVVTVIINYIYAIPILSQMYSTSISPLQIIVPVFGFILYYFAHLAIYIELVSMAKPCKRRLNCICMLNLGENLYDVIEVSKPACIARYCYERIQKSHEYFEDLSCQINTV